MVAKVTGRKHSHNCNITMQRNKSSNSWIVQKLIERDHMNNHYRRLNSAQSQLHLNKRTVTFSNNRLSKSNNDVRFENQLQSIERQMGSTFCLDVTPHSSEKKKEISDESKDVMARHSQYFTQPTKQFTPRVLRKIVQPNSSPPNRMLSNSRPVSSEIRPVKAVRTPAVTPRKAKKVFVPADQRNVSDDSAFGDEHSTDTSTESTSDSNGLAAFNIKMWLKEQEEENRYMQLMCDITADLLQRKLCTNGAIKEIIAIYIRKSKKKFSVGTNVLMKRLCEDLMLPTENGSLDEQYYGSRYTAGSNYSYRSRHKEDYRNLLKEIQPLDHFPKSSNVIDQNDRSCQKNHRYEQSSKSSSFNKPNNLELEVKELGLLEDKPPSAPKSDDVTKREKNQHSSQFRMPLTIQKTETVKDPEFEGYFSDFTNDTDNDIEEEFDFD